MNYANPSQGSIVRGADLDRLPVNAYLPLSGRWIPMRTFTSVAVACPILAKERVDFSGPEIKVNPAKARTPGKSLMMPRA